jgi:hypothetical protein
VDEQALLQAIRGAIGLDDNPDREETDRRRLLRVASEAKFL